jgi:integrase
VKTGETEGDQEVALGDEAIAVLESMMPVNPVGPLFPGRDGKKARTTVRRPWVQACKAAELFTKSEVEGKRKNKDGSPKMLTKYKPSMRIHDMRHNIISWLASEGFSLPLIGSIVNQSTEAVTEGYAKIDYAPQRKALNAYGDFIRKCRAGNVIAISTKTGTK